MKPEQGKVTQISVEKVTNDNQSDVAAYLAMR